MPGLLTLSLLIAHLDVAGFRAQVDAGKPPLDSDSISKLLLLAALRATQFRGLSSTDIARDISLEGLESLFLWPLLRIFNRTGSANRAGSSGS